MEVHLALSPVELILARTCLLPRRVLLTHLRLAGV
jgi:hypothetical protein